MPTSPQLLVHNIGELVTLEPAARSKEYLCSETEVIGAVRDAWLLCANGKVLEWGQGPNKHLGDPRITKLDAQGKLVLPGLVDSHTHPLFAGSRFDEFCERLNGATYQDIAKKGGGISSTVRATRKASDAELLELLKERLSNFLSLGVTTVEVKSGYALSPEEELRHLRILARAKNEGPQHLEVTSLALHARSLEGTPNAEFIAQMAQTLPVIAREKLASWVDVFVEEGYFSGTECNTYMQKARELGLGVRVHADEFSNSQGASYAAQWGAKSADHLQHADRSGIAAMASGGVVATLLPGTSLYTNIPFTQGPQFIAAGCPVAVATDYNPGSCQLWNLPQLAGLAAVHCKLKIQQAIAGVTLVPAFSLGLENRKGALVKGYDADFVVHALRSKEEWIADFGQTRPSQVWIAQKRVI